MLFHIFAKISKRVAIVLGELVVYMPIFEGSKKMKIIRNLNNNCKFLKILINKLYKCFIIIKFQNI